MTWTEPPLADPDFALPEPPGAGAILLLKAPVWGGKSGLLSLLAEKQGEPIYSLSGARAFRFPWDFQPGQFFLDDLQLWSRYKRLRRMSLVTWVTNHLKSGHSLTATWGHLTLEPWPDEWPAPEVFEIPQPEEGTLGTDLLFSRTRDPEARLRAMALLMDIQTERIRGDLTARWSLAELALAEGQILNLSQIARILEISPQALLPVLQALEEAGLLVRRNRLWRLRDSRWAGVWGDIREFPKGTNTPFSGKEVPKKTRKKVVRQPAPPSSWQPDWD